MKLNLKLKSFLSKYNIKYNILLNIISKLKNSKNLIVGDFILDRYTFCTALGKTSKTPTLSILQNHSKDFFGGSSLILNNFLSFNSNSNLISLFGKDKTYEIIKNNKIFENIFVFLDKKRPTTIKNRIMVDGYKILQINNLSNDPINEYLENKIIFLLKKKIKFYNNIIIADNRHGLITKNLINNINNMCKTYKKNLIVDTQVSNRVGNLKNYENIPDIIFVNDLEARFYLQDLDSSSKAIFHSLKKKINPKILVYKLGAKGSIMNYGNIVYEIPAMQAKIIDPIGSGDCFLSYFISSLEIFPKPEYALFLATLAAGLFCENIGTEPIKLKVLKSNINILYNKKL